MLRPAHGARIALGATFPILVVSAGARGAVACGIVVKFANATLVASVSSEIEQATVLRPAVGARVARSRGTNLVRVKSVITWCAGLDPSRLQTEISRGTLEALERVVGARSGAVLACRTVQARGRERRA